MSTAADQRAGCEAQKGQPLPLEGQPSEVSGVGPAAVIVPDRPCLFPRCIQEVPERHRAQVHRGHWGGTEWCDDLFCHEYDPAALALQEAPE